MLFFSYLKSISVYISKLSQKIITIDCDRNKDKRIQIKNTNYYHLFIASTLGISSLYDIKPWASLVTLVLLFRFNSFLSCWGIDLPRRALFTPVMVQLLYLLSLLYFLLRVGFFSYEPRGRRRTSVMNSNVGFLLLKFS